MKTKLHRFAATQTYTMKFRLSALALLQLVIVCFGTVRSEGISKFDRKLQEYREYASVIEPRFLGADEQVCKVPCTKNKFKCFKNCEKKKGRMSGTMTTKRRMMMMMMTKTTTSRNRMGRKGRGTVRMSRGGAAVRMSRGAMREIRDLKGSGSTKSNGRTAMVKAKKTKSKSMVKSCQKRCKQAKARCTWKCFFSSCKRLCKPFVTPCLDKCDRKFGNDGEGRVSCRIGCYKTEKKGINTCLRECTRATKKTSSPEDVSASSPGSGGSGESASSETPSSTSSPAS